MKQKKIEAVIFDLDGTLLNTLDDLWHSTNFALNEMMYPERTREEVRMFVGNGVRKLIERAVPEHTKLDDVERTLKIFEEHYKEHCNDCTGCYAGIRELLSQLKTMGIKMAIVSNKFHLAVSQLNQRYFSEYIKVAIGEQESKGIRKKPYPDTVLQAMSELNCLPENTIYVGDSDVDIETARNSLIPCVSVDWGFRDEEFLFEHGATKVIHSPEELLSIVKG